MTGLIVRILTTWRLASLLHSEEGPFEIFAQLRDAAGVRFDERSQPTADNQIGKMLACFWCTSIWAALAVGLIEGKVSLLDILGYSGGAILVNEWIGHHRE